VVPVADRWEHPVAHPAANRVSEEAFLRIEQTVEVEEVLRVGPGWPVGR